MIDEVLAERVTNNMKFYPSLVSEKIVQSGRQEKKRSEFLKTEEELDVDIYQLRSVQENRDSNNFYLQIIEHKDGYINISIPARIDSGFMEENY